MNAEPQYWGDGTPLLRGSVTAPWGSVPGERWVRVMAENCAPGLWDVSGCARIVDDLPISDDLRQRIMRWQAWYDELDALNTSFPRPTYWEQRDDMPITVFNAEGRAIARAIQAELPGWTVVAVDVDAWLRTDDDDSELHLPRH